MHAAKLPPSNSPVGHPKQKELMDFARKAEPSLELQVPFYAANGIEFGILYLFERPANLPSYKEYPAWQFAKILMGQNFHGLDEFEEDIRSFLFQKTNLVKITNVPWTKEILAGPCPFNPGKTVKETHVLSLSTVRNEETRAFWFEWILVLKNPPPLKKKSFLRNWIMALRSLMGLDELSDLPSQYGTRRASTYDDGGTVVKIIARKPEM